MQPFAVPALVTPSLVVAAWLIRAGLSAIRTKATEVERLLDGLFARVGLQDLYLHADPAVVAGVGALVLVVVGCCVEGVAGWRYSVLAHISS